MDWHLLYWYVSFCVSWRWVDPHKTHTIIITSRSLKADATCLTWQIHPVFVLHVVLISLSLVSACALFGFQINWLWSERIWRGLKLWDTADRIMWIWSRFIQKRFSVRWWTWLNEHLLRRCGWVYVAPVFLAHGSGWVERPCAIRTGLQGTAHQRTTVKTQWDLDQFSLEEISAGSAVLNTTNSTSSAADINRPLM